MRQPGLAGAVRQVAQGFATKAADAAGGDDFQARPELVAHRGGAVGVRGREKGQECREKGQECREKGQECRDGEVRGGEVRRFRGRHGVEVELSHVPDQGVYGDDVLLGVDSRDLRSIDAAVAI